VNTTQRRKRATIVRPAHLRVDVFDALCSARGATGYRECAALFGLDFSHLSRLRRQLSEASIGTAIHIAQTLGVPVEALFIPAAISDEDAA
jgi:transcriptional regulator with XRE-family HTH domain